MQALYITAALAAVSMFFSLVVAYLSASESSAVHWFLCMGLAGECYLLYVELKLARSNLMQPFDAFHTL
jgi:hypothetical protein